MLYRRNASTITWACLGLLTTVVLLAGCSARVHAGQARDEFHRTYPLAAGGRVQLSNINGTVTLVAADTNEVEIDAVKRGSDPEQLERCRIEVAASPDSIRIETRYDKSGWFGNNNNASVDYTITVPRTAHLENIKTVNGRIAITGVTGDIQASVVNGGVHAEDVTGALDLSSVNGGVDVTLKSAAKSARLHSVNGGVSLTAPSDLQAEVKASTVNGGISNDFGLTVNKGRHVGSSMDGRLGSGTARIELNTVNGGIHLRRTMDGKPLSNPESQQSQREQGGDKEPL